MANLTPTSRHDSLESGDTFGHMGGHVLSLKWGAIALLVLLAIITAAVISMLRYQAAAKQAVTTDASISHGTKSTPAPAPAPTTETSNAQIQSSHSVSTQTTNNGAKSSTNVIVNGQQVPVPTNGTVHKEVIDVDGNKAEVNISSSSTQSESSVNSSVNVNVSSEQSTVDNSE